MNLFKIKHQARAKRLLLVLSLALGTSLAVALVLYALRQNINLFYTPTQIVQQEAPQNLRIRIGGVVKSGTLQRGSGLQVSFLLSDLNQEVQVHYSGILPDLFREGQGVVALGVLTADQVFKADEILAKHDENYMPPEVGDSLKKSIVQAEESAIESKRRSLKGPLVQVDERAIESKGSSLKKPMVVQVGERVTEGKRSMK